MLPIIISSLPSTPILNLKDYDIHRIPDTVYQIMFDVIDSNMPIANNQARIKKILLEWLADTYPDKELEMFEEITNEQAAILQNRIPGITFGFYIKLLNKIQNEKINYLPTSGSSDSRQLHEEQH